MIGPAIETIELSKHYGTVAALSRLSLTVPVGSIFGFLGPNGAGKTTTIRLLLGFNRPTAGEARLFGHDCWRQGVRARQRVGYLVGAESLYPELTGDALLDFAAALSDRPPILRPLLLDALELGPESRRRKIGTYSKGMKQKVALVAAMQHDPELLILDEPSDGLDPLIQRSLEEVLTLLNRRGRTIFMSSHVLPEVERVCERVAIVRDGKLLAEETIADLQRHHRRVATVRFHGPAPAGLDRLPGVVSAHTEGGVAELGVEGEVGPLLRALAAHDVADLQLPSPRLEDIFLGFYDSAGGRNGVSGKLVEEPATPAEARR